MPKSFHSVPKNTYIHNCPVCGRPLIIQSDHVGLQVYCHHCHGAFIARGDTKPSRNLPKRTPHHKAAPKRQPAAPPLQVPSEYDTQPSLNGFEIVTRSGYTLRFPREYAIDTIAEIVRKLEPSMNSQSH